MRNGINISLVERKVVFIILFWMVLFLLLLCPFHCFFSRVLMVSINETGKGKEGQSEAGGLPLMLVSSARTCQEMEEMMVL